MKHGWRTRVVWKLRKGRVTASLKYNATCAATVVGFIMLAFVTVNTGGTPVRTGDGGAAGLLFLVVFPDLTDEVTESLVDVDALLG